MSDQEQPAVIPDSVTESIPDYADYVAWKNGPPPPESGPKHHEGDSVPTEHVIFTARGYTLDYSRNSDGSYGINHALSNGTAPAHFSFTDYEAGVTDDIEWVPEEGPVIKLRG